MSRWAVAAAAVAAAAALAAIWLSDDSSDDAPASASTPNFVVVLTDDQDAASLDVMPKLRRALRARGVTFSRAYATVPECCPSRASLLTGRYAHNHGVVSNDPPDGGFGAFEDDETLPVWLQEGGYRTGYVGKYLNGYGWAALGNSPTYVPPGWDRWAALVDHTEYQMYGYHLNHDGEVKAYGESARDYQTDELARLGARFIRDAPRAPFFLMVAPLAPHDEGVLDGTAFRNPRPAARHEGAFADTALPATASFNEADVTDKPPHVRRKPPLTEEEVLELSTLNVSRLESLLAVDDLVARLLRTLRKTGELEDTVFIFTSDNGFLLGQHRLKGKRVVYEEAARVPLVIRGPGFAQAETRSQLVGNVDLAPTIIELAGIQPGAEVDGRSLLPLAADPDADRDRDLLLEMLTDHPFAALRTRRYVYAKYASGAAEMYDLRRDPYELDNLVHQPAYAPLRERLAARLDSVRDCAGASCP